MRAPMTRRDSAAAVMSRSTSDRCTFTPAIAAPDTARSRSRAIVSVSGSSGTALLLPPADIAAELLPFELDLAGHARALAPRGVERGCDGRHREHSAPRSNQLSARIEGCSGVKDVNVSLAGRQSDRAAPARLVGITCC